MDYKKLLFTSTVLTGMLSLGAANNEKTAHADTIDANSVVESNTEVTPQSNVITVKNTKATPAPAAEAPKVETPTVENTSHVTETKQEVSPAVEKTEVQPTTEEKATQGQIQNQMNKETSHMNQDQNKVGQLDNGNTLGDNQNTAQQSSNKKKANIQINQENQISKKAENQEASPVIDQLVHGNKQNIHDALIIDPISEDGNRTEISKDWGKQEEEIKKFIRENSDKETIHMKDGRPQLTEKQAWEANLYLMERINATRRKQGLDEFIVTRKLFDEISKKTEVEGYLEIYRNTDYAGFIGNALRCVDSLINIDGNNDWKVREALLKNYRKAMEMSFAFIPCSTISGDGWYLYFAIQPMTQELVNHAHDLDVYAEAKPETKPEQPETKPDTKPILPETKPETKPDNKPILPDTEPETKPETKPENPGDGIIGNDGISKPEENPNDTFDDEDPDESWNIGDNSLDSNETLDDDDQYYGSSDDDIEDKNNLTMEESTKNGSMGSTTGTTTSAASSTQGTTGHLVSSAKKYVVTPEVEAAEIIPTATKTTNGDTLPQTGSSKQEALAALGVMTVTMSSLLAVAAFRRRKEH